jgi:hypothetical protein
MPLNLVPPGISKLRDKLKKAGKPMRINRFPRFFSFLCFLFKDSFHRYQLKRKLVLLEFVQTFHCPQPVV